MSTTNLSTLQHWNSEIHDLVNLFRTISGLEEKELNKTKNIPSLIQTLSENLAELQTLIPIAASNATSKKLEKVEKTVQHILSLKKIKGISKQKISDILNHATQCQSSLKEAKKLIPTRSSPTKKSTSGKQIGAFLISSFLPIGSKLLISISKDVVKDLDQQIQRKENEIRELGNREATLECIKNISSVISSYLNDPKKCPSFLHNSPLGSLITHLNVQDPNFVRKVIQVNLLIMCSNFYHNLEKIQQESPYIIFELIEKILNEANTHAERVNVIQTWKEEAQESSAYQDELIKENIESFLSTIFFPMILPNGAQDLYIPDIFPNLPGLNINSIKEKVHAKFMDLPQKMAEKTSHTLSKKTSLQTKLLIKLYKKALKLLNYNRSQSLHLQTNIKQPLPKTLRKKLSQQIARSVKNAFSEYTTIGPLYQKISSLLSSLIFQSVSPPSLIEISEKALQYITKKITKKLTQQVTETSSRKPDSELLEELQNRLDHELSARFERTWHRLKRSLPEEKRSFKDQTHAMFTRIYNAALFIGLKFIFFVTQAEKLSLFFKTRAGKTASEMPIDYFLKEIISFLLQEINPPKPKEQP